MNVSYLKKICPLFIATLVCCSALNAAAQEEAKEEEESPYSLSISTDIASDYMFRGQNLYQGTSIQPSVGGGYSFGDFGSLDANIWSHNPAEDGHGPQEKYNEIDYTISYSISWDILTLGVGNLWYTYPHQSDVDIEATYEYFISASLDTILTPTLTFYHDYRLYQTNIFELGFSHSFENESLGKDVSVTPSVIFGFGQNTDKVYAEDSGLLYISTGVGAELPLAMLKITPSLNYNFKIDDSTINEFWFKVGIAYSL